MRILVDSHVLLWTLNDSQFLGPKTQQTLSDGTNTIFVSTASLWELALKHAKGKLDYGPEELLDGVNKLQFTMLPITETDILTLSDIHLPHKDPFDTLLVAQAVAQDLDFMTAEANILAATNHALDASK